jgi:V/A-type H+/Na+-transporting ATPase subunit C
VGDYDYANSRLRALKSQLLVRRTLLEFSALTRVDDLTARLADSPYGEEVRTALARYSGPRVVMEACRLHLAATFRKVRTFFDEEGGRLMSVLLGRYDLFNLKTILRGQEARTPAAEILEALVPAGDLDESALRTLVRQPDPTATADLLRTWNASYAGAVRQALAAYANTHDWNAFERALDAEWYRRLLGSLQKSEENDGQVNELLAREIDAANTMTALRLREADGAMVQDEVKERLLEGGEMAIDWFVGLARASREDEALSALRASKFGGALAKVETLDLDRIQHDLDCDLARFGMSYLARDPLTISTAIGFITAKKVEATNLRVIAHGIALGLGRAEIEKKLVA